MGSLALGDLAPVIGAEAVPSPWLEPYRGELAMIEALAGWRPAGLTATLPGLPPGRVAEVLSRAADQQERVKGWRQACPVRFTAAASGLAAAPGPAGMAYEQRIREHRLVPTRDNVHDFFNGLVWLRFGALKWQLNAAQLQAMAEGPPEGRSHRGARRDALTLLDENGALWCGPAALADAWAQHDWQGLFIAQREAWRHCQLVLIGHGLLEKLLAPRPAITAHAWCLGDAGPGALADLAAEQLATLTLRPLPVLGVPGWWNPNRDPEFYANDRVFRPSRQRQASSP